MKNIGTLLGLALLYLLGPAPLRAQVAGVDFQTASVHASLGAYVGQEIALQGDIHNIGSSAAGSSAMSFYLSTDRTLDPTDVLLATQAGGAISPMRRVTLFTRAVVPAGTQPGSYLILFVADPQNAFVEANEANNIADHPFNVVMATADVDADAGYRVAVAPNPAAGGAVVNCRWLGADKAGVATVSLYNTLGQLVQAQAMQPGAGAREASMQTQGLAAGCYVVRLVGPGVLVTRRLLIE